MNLLSDSQGDSGFPESRFTALQSMIVAQDQGVQVSKAGHACQSLARSKLLLVFDLHTCGPARGRNLDLHREAVTARARLIAPRNSEQQLHV